MPELPEVETIRRDLAGNIVGSHIISVDVLDARVLRQPALDFMERLKNKRIIRIDRRGKALIIVLIAGEARNDPPGCLSPVENDFLVVQVMMTGQLVVNGPQDTHTRIRFTLDKGHLLYNDQRVFGQLRVVSSLKEIAHFDHLGSEPFADEFSAGYIKQYLSRTSRPIKNVLLDHGFVAGIGNIYASEILFRAKISPQRVGTRIKATEIPLLLEITRCVLQQAIDLRGSSMRNYRDGAGQKGKFNQAIAVYARTNEPCLVCQTPIERIVQSGRSTFYCRKCQR